MDLQYYKQYEPLFGASDAGTVGGFAECRCIIIRSNRNK